MPGEGVELVDPDNGARLRIVEHAGNVYFEAVSWHGATKVYNLLRVPRDIAVPLIRRVFV